MIEIIIATIAGIGFVLLVIGAFFATAEPKEPRDND